METNYTADIIRLYANCQENPLPLNEEYTIRAGVIVERLFPPSTADEAFQVLASLNLLNAVVKRQWGRRLVCYAYIKGMAADLLHWLILHPIDGVSAYWDGIERIVYFRVWGVQLSFHYIPMTEELLASIADACLKPQQWTGIQLQKIAVEVFRLAVPDNVDYDSHEEEYVRYVLSHCSQSSSDGQPDRDTSEECYPDPGSICYDVPFSEDKMQSLHTALHFHIWRQGVFTLWRRKDKRPMPVVRYDGSNYRALMNYLLAGDPRIPRRPRKNLVKGALYYVSPKKRITCMNRSAYVLKMSQNNYLRTGSGYRNLCVTYGIARYLGMLHPTLKFACTLNINHIAEQRRFYSYTELCRVPLPSPARMLKVWIVMDTKNLLDDFSIESLPKALMDDYMQTEDYYQEFEIVSDSRGLKGIVAYRQHIILPTDYCDIELHNYHANVLGDNGLWAIFSLNEERFLSDFVYEKIWYDWWRTAILGTIAGREKIIYSFRLNEPHVY